MKKAKQNNSVGSEQLHNLIKKNKSQNIRNSTFHVEYEQPHQLLCPISHQIMQIPVIAADGIAYDRQNIQKWFRQSNKSPMTNLPLSNKKLMTSKTLLEAIEMYRYRNYYVKKLNFYDKYQKNLKKSPQKKPNNDIKYYLNKIKKKQKKQEKNQSQINEIKKVKVKRLEQRDKYQMRINIYSKSLDLKLNEIRNRSIEQRQRLKSTFNRQKRYKSNSSFQNLHKPLLSSRIESLFQSYFIS